MTLTRKEKGIARATAGSAFLTAAVTLTAQILVHRMVSAKFLNNYAFVVISLTMLGFAFFFGVILTRYLESYIRNIRESIAVFSVLFVGTLLGGAALLYHADVEANYHVSRSGYLLVFLRTIPFALVFALPFTFSGLILGILLTAPEFPTRRIYFYDLLGSALGAFAVIPGLAWIGVENSCLFACALLLVGNLVLFMPRKWSVRLLSGLTLLALVFAFLYSERLFRMRYASGSMLAQIEKLDAPFGVEHVAWDPVARIEVSRIPVPDPENFRYPALIGSDREFLQQFERMLTQNNFAFTYALDYDGKPESLQGIRETLYATAYEISSVQNLRAVAIGVGGGFDMLTALAYGAREVTGVEINAATYRILTDTYGDYFANWVSDPRVNLVLSEGRDYLSQIDRRYDVIQLSGVDTFSGTVASAHVFSENYLYTLEAFELFLSRLTDDGILNLMRP